MAVYISHQPKDFFNIVDWAGTGGTTDKAITGLPFQPDVTWVKDYKSGSGNNHILFDSVRGAGADKEVMPETNGAEGNGNTSLYGFVQSFDSYGFTLDMGSSSPDYVNKSPQTYMAWNWKAGTTTGLSGGTITPSAYSINTTSKFGIYKYTGNGTSGATIAHGLGAVPTAIWVKKLSATASWQVGHAYMTEGDGNDWGSAAELNDGTVVSDSAAYWNDTDPTSTLVTLGNDARCNTDTATYVMYVWCNVLGSQRFGLYQGNGNASGPTVILGFQPELVIIHRLADYAWIMFNEPFPGYNVTPNRLRCNTNTGFITTSTEQIDILANGFKLRSTGGSETNTSGANHIYFAWSKFPIVSSNGIPGVAR